MTSVRHDTVQPDATTMLALKSGVEAGAPPTGFVDGAWRPGSRDLAREVPGLLKALPQALGRMERVSYNLTTWGATIRVLHFDGADVHLAGYRSQNPDTIDVVGRDRRITLVVVPPEAGKDVSRQAMAAASATGNADSPADLLAGIDERPSLSAH